MRAYLAGPMTGIPRFNFPAFLDAAARLRHEGWEIISPAEIDAPDTRAAAMSSPNGELGSGTLNGETWGDFLARDVKIVADDVNAIIFLPNWEKSRGARLEAHVALLNGHRFYRYDPDVEGAVYPMDPDSVTRRLHENPNGPDEEVRVTDPVTGGMKGSKMAQVGALEGQALLSIARVAGFGAQKYARHNYLNGYAWSLSYDAMQRHLLAWQSGEDLDPESGLPHLAHAGWHCIALLAFSLHDLGTDDRWTPPE